MASFSPEFHLVAWMGLVSHEVDNEGRQDSSTDDSVIPNLLKVLKSPAPAAANSYSTHHYNYCIIIISAKI